MSLVEFSRPAALGAKLAATDASTIEHLFTTKRILLRLEEALGEVPEARETLILLTNEVLRFCPDIIVELPAAAHGLMGALEQLAVEIHGHSKITLGTSESSSSDAIVNIGTEIRAAANWITVNSDGWLCRVATSNGTAVALPRAYIRPNPFGAPSRAGARADDQGVSAGRRHRVSVGRATAPVWKTRAPRHRSSRTRPV